MKIITTPMCEDVLKISGLKDYTVVQPDMIKDADVAVLLSETRSEIPKIAVKLNTYCQVYESVLKIQKEFNTQCDDEKISLIKKLINDNNEKKDNRKDTKVKVYSNFLKDVVIDMGFTITDNDYDYVVAPDYMDVNEADKEIVVISSHKNVTSDVIERVEERYNLLERRLCMKQ